MKGRRIVGCPYGDTFAMYFVYQMKTGAIVFTTISFTINIRSSARTCSLLTKLPYCRAKFRDPFFGFEEI